MTYFIGITTGDLDGVGLEVAYKALARLKVPKDVCFVLWRGPNISPSWQRKLKKKFNSLELNSLAEALLVRQPRNKLLQIISDRSPALWVEEAAKACLAGTLSAMATGPLSKPEILNAGLSDIGHTDILKRLCSAPTAYMAFLGNKFNVVLATGHKPLASVSQHLTPLTLRDCLLASQQLRTLLPRAKSQLPVGILGLNPHAGDSGLIGTEEALLFADLPYLKKKTGFELEGPLVPDVAFQKRYWQKYSFYMALYHDQGLIPFKLIHPSGEGVHLTLGLPIKRTSVDHGTAKDIFGLNRADSGSMQSAITWAVRWAKTEKTWS